jgi:hypothetical protein
LKLHLEEILSEAFLLFTNWIDCLII